MRNAADAARGASVRLSRGLARLESILEGRDEASPRSENVPPSDPRIVAGRAYDRTMSGPMLETPGKLTGNRRAAALNTRSERSLGVGVG